MVIYSNRCLIHVHVGGSWVVCHVVGSQSSGGHETGTGLSQRGTVTEGFSRSETGERAFPEARKNNVNITTSGNSLSNHLFSALLSSFDRRTLH